MLPTLQSLLAFLCLSTALIAGAAEPVTAPRPAATVKKEGKRVTIDVVMNVPVSETTAWAVLTDFRNMARFIPNLESSDAIDEEPSQLRVTQKGHTHWGPLNFDFESVRRIKLHPKSRIESTTLSGKISKMSSVCQIVRADDGTHIQYHADAEIDFWLPPIVGISAMRSEMEEQFGAMAAEMLRREPPTAKAANDH